MVFWHPKGWAMWQQVEQYMRRIYQENGYQEVKCPQILDRTLWEKSGHWANFKDNMFTTESEKREFAIKPMNCPGHIQIFNTGLHSYRELPLRYGEFGSCHRNEPSGALHGIMRVRSFTQDDGHIFCTEDQIQAEVTAFNDLVRKVYADFGFHNIIVKLALRPEKRVGSDAVWEKAEQALREALKTSGLEWDELLGEGAFYGPKIEFHIKDAIGRSWQCGTIQVDFSMPQRLDAEFVGEDNARHTPVMLHRAILGSLERFIGILIENCAGAMPLWLSPVQAVVLNISEKQSEYAESVAKALRNAGLRADADLRNEKITYKIREHSLNKLPYQIVVGDKEMAANLVAVRTRGGHDLGQVPLETLIERLLGEVAARSGTA
jgi:threonyl-tRNA synthetase